MFVGAPVAQSPSYGQIELANPVQLAFNDILYKVLCLLNAASNAKYQN